MGFFDFLKRNAEPADSSEPLPVMPWDGRPSIYSHLKAHLQTQRTREDRERYSLPDEELIRAKSKVRWMLGACDGVAVFHMGFPPDQNVIDTLSHLLIRYCAEPTAQIKAQLYEQIVASQVVSLVDPVINSLREHHELNLHRLRDLAVWLATEAPDREPVKFGIALMGLLSQPGDLEIFETLGLQDEFTLFSVVAIGNSCENPEAELWKLARSVHGWGRVHTVYRLLETSDPDLKNWLVREGFRNEIMNEYLAVVCARAGDLRAQLMNDEVDRELLTAAGEIIRAMLHGGPAEDIRHYEDREVVIERYLELASSEHDFIPNLLTVGSIKAYLEARAPGNEANKSPPWSEEISQKFLTLCDDVMRRPSLRELVNRQLHSRDKTEFFGAKQAAHFLHIECWSHFWRRLQDDPIVCDHWNDACREVDDSRMTQLVAYAEQHLPLAAIASGPADEVGFGSKFEADNCLDSLISKLADYPGIGSSLLFVGLKSRVAPVRLRTIRTLDAWGKALWPPSMEEAIAEAQSIEPRENVRAALQSLLDGEPVSFS